MLRTLPRDRHGRRGDQRAWYAMLIFFGIILVIAISVSLKDLRDAKRIQNSPPLRSFYDTAPDIPLESLEPSRREKLLRQLNSRRCVCECKLTLAQCRNTDRTCKKSLELALQILKAPSL
jgi:hypothetical protein